jgi:serine/threonine-protein kinase
LQFHGKSTKETVYELMWTDEATYAKLRRLFPAKSSKGREEEYGQGRYQILGELGRGSMGTVYKAYDRTIGRVVAMKTIPVEAEASKREALVERLKQESRAAGTLDHPNIVTVFDVGEEGGVFYFTMQHLEGRTLDAVCQKRELLPLEKVLDIGQQICEGVGFAHQKGIIHRDLKPSNLMLTSQGLVKVMDFGIAKLGDAGLTSAGMILGTPRYLSPEQASGGRVDNRSDIFAIGAILYELLTGEKAFAGETATAVVYQVINVNPIPPKAIERSLPPALDAILLRAMAKDPHHRYQSCDELARVLAQLSAGHSTQKIRTQRMAALAPEEKYEETVVMTPPPSGHRRAALWTATGLLVLVAAGVVGWQKLQPAAQRPAVVEPRAEKTPETPPVLEPPAAGTSLLPAGNSAPTVPRTGKDSGLEKAQAASPLIQPARASSGETTDAPPADKPKAARDARPPAGTESADQPAVHRSQGMFSADDVPGLLSRAQRYAGRGEYDKAIVLYQEILSIQPSNGEARQGLQRAREARKAGR